MEQISVLPGLMDGKIIMVSDLDFEELVERYYRPLYRFAFSLTHSEADACDLTQETFYIWATKGGQLRDSSKVKQWLFTTLHRQFLGQRRRTDRFPHHELDHVSHELPQIDPASFQHADVNIMLSALEEVSETYRSALVLFYLENRAYREVSEILHVPMGTVQSRIARGLAQLQQIIHSRDAASSMKGVKHG